MVKVGVIKQVVPENRFEERITDWLSKHPNAKIQSTAGVNGHLVIFYEE